MPNTADGSRLPDDFRATDEMITWARENTPNVGRAATDAFVDYWKALPGSRGRKTDWLATWRNWMRREQTDIERRPSFRGTPVQTAVDAVVSRRPAVGEMCADHRGHRAATCGLCRAERIGMPWTSSHSLPAETPAAEQAAAVELAARSAHLPPGSRPGPPSVGSYDHLLPGQATAGSGRTP